MAADPSGPDPKSLWKDQEQEADALTLEQVHALVRRYDARDKRVIIALAVVLLMAGALGALVWVKKHDPVMTILFVGGEAGACFQMFRVLLPARDPAEPAGAYLRRRLQSRLAHLQGGWMRVLLPLTPATLWVCYVMYQARQLPLANRLAPFLLIVLGILWTIVRARWRSRKVKADLRELDSLLHH
jgi:hypothetical protein